VSTGEATVVGGATGDPFVYLAALTLGVAGSVLTALVRSRISTGKPATSRIDKELKELEVLIGDAIKILQDARECQGRMDERVKFAERRLDALDKQIERIHDRLDSNGRSSLTR
jgi:hypothetical protein